MATSTTPEMSNPGATRRRWVASRPNQKKVPKGRRLALGFYVVGSPHAVRGALSEK